MLQAIMVCHVCICSLFVVLDIFMTNFAPSLDPERHRQNGAIARNVQMLHHTGEFTMARDEMYGVCIVVSLNRFLIWRKQRCMNGLKMSIQGQELKCTKYVIIWMDSKRLIQISKYLQRRVSTGVNSDSCYSQASNSRFICQQTLFLP